MWIVYIAWDSPFCIFLFLPKVLIIFMIPIAHMYILFREWDRPLGILIYTLSGCGLCVFPTQFIYNIYKYILYILYIFTLFSRRNLAARLSESSGPSVYFS